MTAMVLLAAGLGSAQLDRALPPSSGLVPAVVMAPPSTVAHQTRALMRGDLGGVVARCEPALSETCRFAVSANRSTGKTDYELLEVTTDGGAHLSAGEWKAAGHAGTFAETGDGPSTRSGDARLRPFLDLEHHRAVISADVPP
jgi:hypothetical protein